MLALARTTDSDYYTRAANEDCINGRPWTRTKYQFSGLASQYTYSLGGRLSSITDPSGRSISYTYDFQNAGTPITGHITQVSTSYNGTTTVLAGNPGTISYYPFGPVSGFSFGNGLAFQAQYDSAYRPTSRNDGPLAESITTYDGADNILARTIPQTQNFTYDALNRLYTAADNATGAFGSLSYLYDPNGNRQSETRNGAATNYTYTAGSNWLTQVGSDTRQFNPDGSTATTTSQGSLTYDGYGDLTAVGNIAYSYDPFGRRHGKNVGGTMTAFAYGPNGELLFEVSENTTKSYVYLNGIPLARIDNNSQIYYYHDDHLGAAPLAMTNSTGTTVWAAAYEPFGSATITTGIITNNLRLPGQYFDSETGLYYNNARYYDPKIGRYVSSDPIGLAGGLNTYLYVDSVGIPLAPDLNTYSYARNNPLRWIDPTGLSATVTWGDIGAGLGTGIRWCAARALGVVGAAASMLCGDTPGACKKDCPPCNPPVGTIGYRIDQVPPSKPHQPFPGTHIHLYEMNQNPNNCQCFWSPIGVTEPPPPPGAVPM